ncbi:Lrp/AsnC family transcriptional regulator [Kitasatospora sp. NA04385]|uniref:Lrp/AsnC family transcriptional regulator n=1 Tax=Kitasatospora sp. NA04385 TaxID=2742135 RepID=UPI0015928D71|nr:Lrp/AsnC family transcriptional regulator [Kitasatospora sp. NA04385]QKW20221.1 Lrp/AsnC family transcriptional regulator [Kitasatospora sp. NA04385]
MLDALERAVVQALQVDGRAPFERIGAALGVSAQTVARRYRRLRAEAGLRVVGVADHERAAQAQWVVRVAAVPGAAEEIARALARRPETSWVKLTSAGTQIFAIVRSDLAEHPPVLSRLPHTRGITSVSAHCLLHTYLGGPTAWHGRLQSLTPGQTSLLAPDLPERPATPPTATDLRLLDALRHDGRTPYAELAAAAGCSVGTATRRLAELRSSRQLFFDVEVDPSGYGIATRALLWLTVRPADLDRIGTDLAGHPELAVVAAVTGPANLLAQALCTDPADLHHYLTHRLGAHPEIHHVETEPVVRTVKAVGHLPLAPRPPRSR